MALRSAPKADSESCLPKARAPKTTWSSTYGTSASCAWSRIGSAVASGGGKLCGSLSVAMMALRNGTKSVAYDTLQASVGIAVVAK